MSAHFAVLREAGLVQGDKQGKTVIYRVKMSVLEEALLEVFEAARPQHRTGAGCQTRPSGARQRSLVMRKEILFGLGAASLILAVAAASRYGQSAGLIDGDAGKRVVQVVIGLYLAALGNRMPEQIGALSSVALAKRSQSVLRVGGWSLTVARDLVRPSSGHSRRCQWHVWPP